MKTPFPLKTAKTLGVTSPLLSHVLQWFASRHRNNNEEKSLLRWSGGQKRAITMGSSMLIFTSYCFHEIVFSILMHFSIWLLKGPFDAPMLPAWCNQAAEQDQAGFVLMMRGKWPFYPDFVCLFVCLFSPCGRGSLFVACTCVCIYIYIYLFFNIACYILLICFLGIETLESVDNCFLVRGFVLKGP